MTTTIYAKLIKVQNELKAPKSQFNSFGKYKYRSCEDILEAVKPLLMANNLTLLLNDEVELVGDRFYIKAKAVLIDTENGDTVEASAYARESLDKKGMDSSQVTGATSSYARKYALNGLFLIDDTKDFDTDEATKVNKQSDPTISAEKCKQLYTMANNIGFSNDDVKKAIKAHFNKTSAKELTMKEFKDLLARLEGARK